MWSRTGLIAGVVTQVAYNVFDGEELILDSIRSIKPNVDYIAIVYQTVSIAVLPQALLPWCLTFKEEVCQREDQRTSTSLECCSQWLANARTLTHIHTHTYTKHTHTHTHTHAHKHTYTLTQTSNFGNKGNPLLEKRMQYLLKNGFVDELRRCPCHHFIHWTLNV